MPIPRTNTSRTPGRAPHMPAPNKSWVIRRSGSTHPIHDPGFGRVVGRHLHLHAVTDHQTDETLPHFPGDVRQQFVTTGELHLEHRSRKNRGNDSFHLHRLLLPVRRPVLSAALKIITAPTTTSAAASSASFFWGSWNKSKMVAPKPHEPRRRDHLRFFLLRNRNFPISLGSHPCAWEAIPVPRAPPQQITPPPPPARTSPS